MDQPRVGVKVEDHRFVVREDRGILSVCQAVRMVAVRDQLES